VLSTGDGKYVQMLKLVPSCQDGAAAISILEDMKLHLADGRLYEQHRTVRNCPNANNGFHNCTE
jgi:hypothetical protein